MNIHNAKEGKLLSIIVPCYNEEKVLPLFYEEIVKVLETLTVDCELLFVDDGSKDGTMAILRDLAGRDARVANFSFARNFGKEAAMYAGLCNAKGDYVAVMDADLQDPPSLLPEMLETLRSGAYDSVAARRVSRKGEPVVRSWFARRFYKMLTRYTDVNVMDGARDYRMMRRDMVNAIVAMGETNRFSKGIFGWVGFRTKWLSYENVERVAGETKWTFWQLVRYAIDGLTNFTEAPLRIASWGGLLMTLISLVALIFIIVRRAVFGDPVAGWASTICIVVFIGGLQMLILGVMGQYIAKTYLEVKNRPHFIIAESNRSGVEKIR